MFKSVELGAEDTCNNRTMDVAAWARDMTGGAGVDLVFDHVGEALWGSLTDGGSSRVDVW